MYYFLIILDPKCISDFRIKKVSSLPQPASAVTNFSAISIFQAGPHSPVTQCSAVRFPFFWSKKSLNSEWPPFIGQERLENGCKNPQWVFLVLKSEILSIFLGDEPLMKVDSKI